MPCTHVDHFRQRYFVCRTSLCLQTIIRMSGRHTYALIMMSCVSLAHLNLRLRMRGAAVWRRLCHSITVTCCHAVKAILAEPSQPLSASAGL